MDLRKLSDDELWANTADLAKDERRITFEVLIHLKEVDRRSLHLRRGYPSLYEYTVRELKYAEGAAYRRVQAMRFIRDVPEAEEKIQSGELNLTTAAKVQNACRNLPKEKKKEVLAEVQGKPAKEVDRELTKWQPKTANEFTKWVSTEEIQLTVLLGKPAFKDLEDLKAIKSHSASTFGQVVTELIKLGSQKWNPLQRIAPPLQWSYAPSESRDPRFIPNGLRQEIWRRDQNQCTYVDPTSQLRCNSKSFLQIDHILPVALGGKASPENLRLLCSTHNKLRAIDTFSVKNQ